MINLNEPQLSIKSIDPNAMEIIEALQDRGFKAYLVGGCVRDLLIGLKPKDYDIATDARPNQVRQCVHGAYVIGRRFRLVLVKRGLQQFEVTTFRREAKEEEISDDPRKLENMFGSPEEDARRRDFTINALFYDPIEHKLIDHVNGLADLKRGCVKMIGDPMTRFEEDPIRILRALRLAHKIRFKLDEDLRAAIPKSAHLIPATALPRRREEYLKLLRLDDPCAALVETFDLDALNQMAPLFSKYVSLIKENSEFLERFKKIKQKCDVDWSPPELFALLINAIYRSFLAPDLRNPLKGHELMEHEELNKIMKEELGVFKLECHMILGALHVQSLLLKRQEFESRGPRRREAVLNSESFALALDLLALEGDASAEDLNYWSALAKQKVSTAPQRRSRSSRQSRRRKNRSAAKMAIRNELIDDTEEMG